MQKEKIHKFDNWEEKKRSYILFKLLSIILYLIIIILMH